MIIHPKRYTKSIEQISVNLHLLFIHYLIITPLNTQLLVILKQVELGPILENQNERAIQ